MTFPILPGEKLPNGATLIAVRSTTEIPANDFAVMALSHGEYVTWRSDRNAVTYWGHYFGPDVQKAATDFVNRI